jgi:hypothetical protein
MDKPKIIFFARGYQTYFFPYLTSDKYEAFFVTLTKAEKKSVLNAGCNVVGCFEEEYDTIQPMEFDPEYLLSSFAADRFLGRFTFPKRVEILGKEIGFWNSIFNKYNPTAVFNELIAIEIAEVLLIECKKRNIKYLAAMHSPVDNYFYWLNDPISLSGKHLNLPQEVSQQSYDTANKYISNVIDKNLKPFYVRNLKGRASILPFLVAVYKLVFWNIVNIVSLRSGKFKYELYIEEYSKKISVYLKSFLKSYNTINELPKGKEVIFYPLHQEPESTLNYMSVFYSNQVATLENILKCLSPNQVLAVKEHPVDKGALLRKKFSDLKKMNSGIYFFPGELDGKELMKVSSRIVTLTSTVGWEGIILGKPVYILGQIFYDNLKGVNKINSFDNLKEVLQKSHGENTISREDITQFVAAIVENCYLGNPLPCDYLYHKENIENIKYAISDEISKNITI